jgi:hypothetical protein
MLGLGAGGVSAEVTRAMPRRPAARPAAMMATRATRRRVLWVSVMMLMSAMSHAA